jgi:hypothetical protein
MTGLLVLAEEHDAVGVGAEAVVLDAPDVGGLGEALR